MCFGARCFAKARLMGHIMKRLHRFVLVMLVVNIIRWKVSVLCLCLGLEDLGLQDVAKKIFKKVGLCVWWFGWHHFVYLNKLGLRFPEQRIWLLVVVDEVGYHTWDFKCLEDLAKPQEVCREIIRLLGKRMSTWGWEWRVPEQSMITVPLGTGQRPLKIPQQKARTTLQQYRTHYLYLQRNNLERKQLQI